MGKESDQFGRRFTISKFRIGMSNSRKANKSPKKVQAVKKGLSPGKLKWSKEVERLANADERFLLLQRFCPKVAVGTRRIADVEGVGPADTKKCVMSTAEWDDFIKSRPNDGQCKGSFFTSCKGSHKFRRCEKAVKANLCELCAAMREEARPALYLPLSLPVSLPLPLAFPFQPALAINEATH